MSCRRWPTLSTARRQGLRNADIAARPADLQPPPAPAAIHATAPAPHAATRIVEVRSGGFDWGDAGLGAAAMLSVLGVGAGAVVVTRRSRPGVT